MGTRVVLNLPRVGYGYESRTKPTRSVGMGK